MDPLKPVPIPAGQRLRHARQHLLAPIVFVGAILVVVLLWRDNVAAPTMVGQAEPVTANVASHQPGVLAELTVERFQRVRAGDVIGKVLVVDPKVLEASLDVVRAEIDAMRNDPQAYFPERRYAVDYGQLRLNWIRQKADLAAARADLQFAELDLKRNEQMLKDKIVAQSIYEMSVASRDSLLRQVEELERLVTEGEKTFQTLASTNGSGYETLILGATALQEAQLRLVEAELSPIILRAPIDGIITAISNRTGESVVAGRAIVTIATRNPVRIVGYLRPPLGQEPHPGMKVEVRTRGFRRMAAETVITEIGTQFEELPPPLQSALRIATVEIGLPIEVALPPELGLRAGELVDINVIGGSSSSN